MVLTTELYMNNPPLEEVPKAITKLKNNKALGETNKPSTHTDLSNKFREKNDSIRKECRYHLPNTYKKR